MEDTAAGVVYEQHAFGKFPLCTDGDPACDLNSHLGTCTIRIQLCLDVPEGRIGGCAQTKIVRMDLLQPGLGTDLGQQVASAVLAAAHSAATSRCGAPPGMRGPGRSASARGARTTPHARVPSAR